MKKDKLSSNEELRAQNQIDALKLEMDFGAQSFISGDAPPEIIEQFLKNIRQFETAHQNQESIPIHQYLGKPDIPTIEDPKDDRLPKVLRHIEQLLVTKAIVIERPPHLTDIGWFHFLTKRVFNEEIVPFSAPNYKHYFDYNDYYHDGPYYIEGHVQDAIEDIFDTSRPYEGIWLPDMCRSDREVVPKEKIFNKVNAFRKRYSEIIPVAYSFQNIEVHQGTLYAIIGIEWEGIRIDNGEKETHSGMGICQMLFENDEWMVQGISVPGFEF